MHLVDFLSLSSYILSRNSLSFRSIRELMHCIAPCLPRVHRPGAHFPSGRQTAMATFCQAWNPWNSWHDINLWVSTFLGWRCSGAPQTLSVLANFMCPQLLSVPILKIQRLECIFQRLGAKLGSSLFLREKSKSIMSVKGADRDKACCRKGVHSCGWGGEVDPWGECLEGSFLWTWTPSGSFSCPNQKYQASWQEAC